MSFSARTGTWVSTTTPIKGAATTRDGRWVGIYQRASRAPLFGMNGSTVDLVEIPQRVTFVRPDGRTLTTLSADGDSVIDVHVDPDLLADLTIMTDPADVPGGRAAHLPEGSTLPV